MSLGRFTTPTGDSVFVKVDKPDTTYGEPGTFTATVHLTAAALEELQTMLAPSLKNAVRELKSEGANVSKDDLAMPIRVLEDGSAHVTARIKAGGKNRKTGEEFFNKVAVVDAEGEDAKSLLIGKGSRIKLSADIVPYNFQGKAGVAFRLKQIQVVKLTEVAKAPAKVGKKLPF